MSIIEECYSLSIKSVNNEIAKNLISDRLRNSKKIEKNIQYQSKPDSVQEKFTLALLELSSESIGGSPSGFFSKQSDVNDMEECAEKNYLLALLALRSEMNEEGRIQAGKYLDRALAQSPNDPRIRTLALILQSI